MRDKRLIEEHNYGDITYMYQLVAVETGLKLSLPLIGQLINK